MADEAAQVTAGSSSAEATGLADALGLGSAQLQAVSNTVAIIPAQAVEPPQPLPLIASPAGFTQPAIQSGPTKLFIGSIPAGTTREQVTEEFGKYGQVAEVFVKTDQAQAGRMWGFVTYAFPEGATAAVAALNEQMVFPNALGPLTVSFARSSSAPPSDMSGSGGAGLVARQWNEHALSTPNAIHQHAQRDLHSPDVMGYSSVAGGSPGKSIVHSEHGSPNKKIIASATLSSPDQLRENSVCPDASPFSKMPQSTTLRGEWENVQVTLKLEPNLAFSYREEIFISPEFGTQIKDYHGTYTLYSEDVIAGEPFKVIQLECRWRDENKYGMQPSDKVFEGHISADNNTLIIHHSKRGDFTLSI